MGNAPALVLSPPGVVAPRSEMTADILRSSRLARQQNDQPQRHSAFSDRLSGKTKNPRTAPCPGDLRLVRLEFRRFSDGTQFIVRLSCRLHEACPFRIPAGERRVFP